MSVTRQCHLCWYYESYRNVERWPHHDAQYTLLCVYMCVNGGYIHVVYVLNLFAFLTLMCLYLFVPYIHICTSIFCFSSSTTYARWIYSIRGGKKRKKHTGEFCAPRRNMRHVHEQERKLDYTRRNVYNNIILLNDWDCLSRHVNLLHFSFLLNRKKYNKHIHIMLERTVNKSAT